MGLKDVMISSSLAGETDFRDVYLVQELMDFDLAYVITTMKLSNNDCKCLLIQILQGVSFLHSAKVIHRNLQPRSLLLNKKFKLKIADFGYAVTLDQEFNLTASDNIDCTWYTTPEILFNSRLHGKEVDMWSFGCIFAEMLTGVPIFRGTDAVEQLKEMFRILGTQSDLRFVECFECRKDLMDLPYSPGVGFLSLYPEADQLTIDLLKKMLVNYGAYNIGHQHDN